MKSKLLFALLLSFAAVSPRLQAAKPASTNPGTYTDWHDVDQVTIVQPFQSNSYSRVIVRPLDTSGAALPPAKDNSFNDVKTALATSSEVFASGLREKLGKDVQMGQGGGANALIVKAHIVKSDPGSQAARYFAGFGAGAAKVAISGEIIDGRTNKVLVRFTQERRSGVGMWGGGYRDLLHRSIKQIGGDVAGLVKAF